MHPRTAALIRQLASYGIKINVHENKGWYTVVVNDTPEPRRFSSEVSAENYLFELIAKINKEKVQALCDGLIKSLSGLGVTVEYFGGHNGYLVVIEDTFNINLTDVHDLHILLCALLKVALK